MDNTLIAGMPEVVAYIKKIEEENKQLKTELEDATAREDSMFQTLNKKRKEESEWALKKIEQLTEQVADWKAKARNKSQILMKYLPDYNPLFNPGSDTECIEASLKKIIDENKQLKELTDGIMNEEDTGHILGCNAYEKFCQAMCELNFDEKFISELKEENKQLKEQNKQLKEGTLLKFQEVEIQDLQEEIDELKEKLSDAEYDLDSLKTDLKPLDDMMYEKKISEYEDVVEHVAELEASAQSTENYWKSKCENEESTNKMLMEAIEANSTEMERLQKYSEIMGDIDGDQLTDLLKDYGWEYNDDGELEKVTD